MIAIRLYELVHCRGKSSARMAPRLAPFTESPPGCLGDLLVLLLAWARGSAVTMDHGAGGQEGASIGLESPRLLQRSRTARQASNLASRRASARSL
jgi:hypothetical protein